MRRFVRHAAIGTAALVLGGCSATHTGEGWQCPLAQGSVCTNVAEADPALQAAPPPEFAIRAPLHREQAAGTETRNGNTSPLPAVTGRPEQEGGPEAEDSPCIATCSPFAWLARLFGGSDESGEATANDPASVDEATPETGPEAMAVAGSDDTPAGPGISNTGSQDGEARVAPTHVATMPSGDGNPFDRLRVPETVARIWIAPFVDDGNVWHEGHWVHAVIAPARWRQP